MIAALEMSRAFKALSLRNDDYARGRTLDIMEGEPSSVKIIQQPEPVTFGPDSGTSFTPKSPAIALIRRFVLEKRGSFQLALKQWDEAVDSFTKAIDAAESPRGFLKARSGLALAKYSRALDADDHAAIVAALNETHAIADEAEAISEADVASTGRHNAGAMARRGRDLLLYGIL